MTTTAPIKGVLADEAQRVVGDALQATLVDLIDLGLIAKQAHWNVVGVNFTSVHEDLDELVDVTREFSDATAERATAIGVSPDGRSETVAKTTGATGIGEGWINDTNVVGVIVENLAAVIGGIRERIELSGKSDPVTEDLLIGFAARLEQLHWMWQARQA
ncbi:putative DNA-binding protein [Gordonia araii NBRC 100433]|uniref:Putative DNA-binding protein n=1 Tax=Gordonia araii NBRC 100433 TaxID=1073574 RepID=G7GYL3_9ACTN|nr:DNA starvation/stationary phase protection protein [Gordonia araii]NNG97452.1 DNA starvation/stationary phase protection protein [Gordonia araii NBRC 100433]GAB08688.1 putative DNA-binding protein [Gordonia araii NBRC 100433]